MRLLTDAEVRAARMRSVLLTPHVQNSPLDVVEWMGALQSQDAASGQWSVGVRVAGARDEVVHEAFERGEILRTWPMRSTIHTIPAIDAHWMLALTGVRGLDQMRTRRQQLGLLPQDMEAALAVIAAALSGGRLLSRADLLAEVQDSGIAVNGQRGYHLLLYASQVGLTCMGPQRGTSQTFALLDEWVPRPRLLTRDESLVELAYRYVRSHGPASMKDLAGWTGLTLTDVRAGVAGNDGRLVGVGAGADARWLTAELAEVIADGSLAAHEVVALPGYDEYLLGYKDRSLHGDATLLEKVVPGGNGVFRSTVVADGVVVATWTRTLSASGARISVTPINRLSAGLRSASVRALERYAAFLGRDPEIRFESAT